MNLKKIFNGKGENKIVGIDSNYFVDAILGVAIAILFFILGKLFGVVGAIGIPSIPQSIAGDLGLFLIVVIGAGIFETIFFQEFLLDLADSIFKAPFLVASIVSSVAFSLFHYTVYGGSLYAYGGSFISAFLVGIGFCYLRKYTDSIMAVITAHATLNFIIKFIIELQWIKFG